MRLPLFCLALSLFLFAPKANASYVSSGKSDFAFSGSTTCIPNSGGVTAGNSIVIGVQSNNNATLSISDSRVSTWTVDQSAVSSVTFYVWHGVVTSSGSDTITITKSSGTDLIGAACGEYTSLFSATGAGSGSATTGGIVGKDVVAFASSGGGGIVVTSPFTFRQNIDLTGTHYCAFADLNASSTTTYTATFTNANVSYVVGQNVTVALTQIGGFLTGP